MSSKRIVVAGLFAALALPAASSSAQRLGEVEVGGFGSFTWYDSPYDLARKAGFGARLGVMGSPRSRFYRYALEGDYGYTSSNTKGIPTNATYGEKTIVVPIHLRILYNQPFHWAGASVFGGAGVGRAGFRNSSHDYDNAIATTLGIRYGLGPQTPGRRAVFRADVNADFDGGNRRARYFVTGGLSAMLHKPASDQDGDGVPDANDRCPNTPMGVPVDKQGCPPQSTMVTVMGGGTDTAAVSRAIAEGIRNGLNAIGPLLEQLKSGNVEVQNLTELIQRYVVPVHFGFDSSLVRDEDIKILEGVAEVIKRVYPNALVTIEGFADPAGKPDYNLALSRRRAEAVKSVMISRFNLPSAQFKTIGYGEQTGRQVNPGAQRTEAGALSNRRVVFTIDATQKYR